MSSPVSSLSPTSVQRPSVLTCCAAAVGTIAGRIRPRRIDPAYLGSLPDAGLPTSAATVRVVPLRQVPRAAPTAFVVEGRRHPRRIRIAMTSFVVEHPDATFLVDPAVCRDVMGRAVNELPAVLRVGVRPPADVVSTAEALAELDYDPASIAFALPTHLHWDHGCGLLDLPDLPVRVNGPEWQWAMTGEVAPIGGVRSSMVDRPVTAYQLDGPPVLSFERSHDVMGDGSVLLVDLAGHTPGQVGVLLRTAGGWTLLAGDAAWHGLQVNDVRQKAAYPGLLADVDRDATFRTLHRLHAVRDRVRIVPSHDHDATTRLATTGT